MGGGGGGASSDELTAARGDVLKGKTAVTSDSSDEPVEGTLELTGDAADSHVLSGKTYYNKDPKTRRAGTMPNRGGCGPGAGSRRELIQFRRDTITAVER